ncbi:MAG: hypothetical protein ACI8UP_005089, partial [Porticoccaceae bacterium]
VTINASAIDSGNVGTLISDVMKQAFIFDSIGLGKCRLVSLAVWD